MVGRKLNKMKCPACQNETRHKKLAILQPSYYSSLQIKSKAANKSISHRHTHTHTYTQTHTYTHIHAKRECKVEHRNKMWTATEREDMREGEKRRK